MKLYSAEKPKRMKKKDATKAVEEKSKSKDKGKKKKKKMGFGFLFKLLTGINGLCVGCWSSVVMSG